jgi:hypothetical protein
MATTKKHIAVYLDPAVQQALSEFCEQRGLKSRKGVVFSAGVNTALAEFFGISDTEEGNTPSKEGSIPSKVSNILTEPGSIPSKPSNIPTQSSGSIPSNPSNIPKSATSTIPSGTLAVEVLPGKFQA